VHAAVGTPDRDRPMIGAAHHDSLDDGLAAVQRGGLLSLHLG
jgi:hypothetical protein